MHRLAEAPSRILGVFRPGPRENRLVPTDRRAKAEWLVPPGEDAGATAGEIVLAEPLPHHHRLGLKPARVIERLGDMGDARSVSLIAIHTHDIPRVPRRRAGRGGTRPRRRRSAAAPTCATSRWSPSTARMRATSTTRCLPNRTMPCPGGFRLIVAIADVAHYVRPGSALDHAARTRGNSVYFPDRVVPMLPEALSNGWCSLQPNEDRGCLFVELRIDAGGRKIAHRFGRGLMRSAARLTYEEVQRRT